MSNRLRGDIYGGFYLGNDQQQPSKAGLPVYLDFLWLLFFFFLLFYFLIFFIFPSAFSLLYPLFFPFVPCLFSTEIRFPPWYLWISLLSSCWQLIHRFLLSIQKTPRGPSRWFKQLGILPPASNKLPGAYSKK